MLSYATWILEILVWITFPGLGDFIVQSAKRMMWESLESSCRIVRESQVGAFKKHFIYVLFFSPFDHTVTNVLLSLFYTQETEV